MADPPGDTPSPWAPPPDPIDEPTRLRGSDAPPPPVPPPAGPPPAGPPPAGPPPAGPPPTAPPPGWMPPAAPRRRIWPWAAAGGVLALVVIGSLVVLLVLGGGGSGGVASYYTVTTAAAPEGAEKAWSIEAPDGLDVRSVTALDDGVLVTYSEPYSSEEDDEADDVGTPRVVAYDADGDQVWSKEVDGLEWAAPTADTEGIVLAWGADGLFVLDADSGEEKWSHDDAVGGFALGNRIAAVVSADNTDDDSADRSITLLDADTGKEQASIDGNIITVTDDEEILVRDGDQVRLVDLDGKEIWSAEADGADDDAVTASVSDDVVLIARSPSSNYSDDSDDSEDLDRGLVALDADSGEELWAESGSYRALERGPDGAPAAWELTEPAEHATYDTQPARLATYDADGEVDSVGIDEFSPLGSQGFAHVEGQGDYLALSGEARTVFTADLEKVSLDKPLAALTTDGPYLLDDDELILADWDSGEEKYTIDVGDGATRAIALDGAVAVLRDEDDEVALYR